MLETDTESLSRSRSSASRGQPRGKLFSRARFHFRGIDAADADVHADSMPRPHQRIGHESVAVEDLHHPDFDRTAKQFRRLARCGAAPGSAAAAKNTEIRGAHME
jgi:hypothetical protein